VTRLLQASGLLVVGLVVLTAATPALDKLAHVFIPLIVTVGVVAAVLRVVWFFTR
jgi:hypothetical protein